MTKNQYNRWVSEIRDQEYNDSVHNFNYAQMAKGTWL